MVRKKSAQGSGVRVLAILLNTLKVWNVCQHLCQYECIQVFLLSQNNDWLGRITGRDEANAIHWIFPDRISPSFSWII